MKFRKLLARLGLASVLLSTLSSPLSPAHAQGTAFTYQGRLDIAGSPANGTNDLTFSLYDAASAGATVGTSNIFNDLAITNGLFTVTLDFGPGVFIGANRWLQIAARPGASASAYTNLVPRQALTPAPYSIFAGGVNASSLIGQVTDANLAATLSTPRTFSSPNNLYFGIGSNLTALNASQLASGTVPDARLSANVALRSGGNTFNGTQIITNGNVGIGTTNPAAKLHVNGSGWFGADGGLLPSSAGAGLRAFFEGSQGGGQLYAYNYATAQATNLILQLPGGNVGIGTTIPKSKLEVAGTIAASALRAPGAGINTGTFAFTHRATAGSVFGHQTVMVNPLCDGDADAILIVTHNYSKDTSANPYHTQVVGVFYSGANWVIFHEDNATPMQVGDAFNVMVIKP